MAWAVVAAATFTMTVSYVDRQTLAVLAPTVTAKLRITDTQYGWVTAAFSAAYLIATPLAGWWLDRRGARRGLVVSVLLWSVVAGLHSFALGLGSLLVLRIALGAAEGPGFPGASQTVQRVLPPEDRSRGFGLLFTGSSIGGMVAPPLAVWLYHQAGWRVAFLGTAAIGLSWLPVWLLLTRRTDVRARLDFTPPAAAPRRSILWLLGEPMMLRALFAIFAVAPVMGFGFAWGAKYLAAAHQVAQGDVGVYLWLPPLLLDVGAIGFGDLASRQVRAPGVPPRGLLALAALLTASLALLPLATTAWQGTEIVALALAGGGACYALVTADLLARVPADSIALAGGILACAQSAAFIVANPAIGACVDRLHDYTTISIILGAWVVPGTVAWLVWPIKKEVPDVSS